MSLNAHRGSWLGLLVVLGALFLPASGTRAAMPLSACPPVNNTTKYTIAYGSVTLGGVAAPIGSVVEARSPRGDAVGCWVVTTAGSYGMMYVYGEDTSVSPTIPGMRADETVAFRVDGSAATAAPGLTWTNDGQSGSPHPVSLAASAAPPVIPVVTAARSGSSVVLTWPHAAANASYQVWRGISPYFASNSGGSSIMGDGAAGNCTNNGVTVVCSDANAIGGANPNYFYFVRAFNSVGASVDSNRTGEFDFTLTPGSQ